jgi:hypothetical protein
MAIGAGRVFAINLIANSKPAEDAFKKVGQSAGRLATPMGIAAAAITAGFTVAIAAVAKVGQALFKLGQDFDDVYDNIRIQTGATGAVFEGLQESFREVAAVVPNDFAQVGTAIQDLNTRLGLTGQPLEELAIQLLTVSRLMGGDVQTNVRNATRLFQQFGVDGEDQADTQASGIGFSELAAQVVDNGVAFRGLGFTVEDSIAMLALFEREGVDTAGVMGALERGVGRLSAAGGDVPAAFRDAIAAIAEAKTQSEAFGIASEVVGARGAQRLIDAVQNGRLDIDEFSEALAANGETILGAAGDTDGFREAWDRFKNYVKIQLEPVATAVFANLEALVAGLTPAVDRVKEAFEKDGLEGALAQLAIEWDKVYKEQLEPLWIRFLAFLDETVKPIALELGKEIGSAIASGMWSAFKAGVSNLFGPALGERVLKDLGADFGLSAPQRGPSLADRLRSGGYLGDLMHVPSSSGPDSAGVRNMLRLADGGLVTSPVMAQVGEAGPEVVIPLDRFERQYGDGGQSIVINVTGALDAEGVARQIEKVLRDSRRRTGGVLV